MRSDELFVAAKELQAPYELVREVAERGSKTAITRRPWTDKNTQTASISANSLTASSSRPRTLRPSSLQRPIISFNNWSTVNS